MTQAVSIFMLAAMTACSTVNSGEPQEQALATEAADPTPAPSRSPKTALTPLAPAKSVADLPLILTRAKGAPADVLAVMITGDGGWAGLDLQLGGYLATRGIDVVGLSTLKYFWKKKTPEQTAADVARIVRHFAAAWGKSRILLIGYSRGAEVVPFVANRLPPDVVQRSVGIALLGPAHSTVFEIRLRDLVRDPSPGELMPVMPEVEKLKGKPLLCVYGSEEKETLCKDLAPARARVLKLQGGHHFGGHYRTIADAILALLDEPGRK